MLLFTGGDGSVTVAPGGTFSFDVYLGLDASHQVVGFDYLLEGSGLFYESDFRLLDRASNLAFFPELNTPDADVVTPLADALLSPVNARSLGATVLFPFPDPYVPISGAGNYLLATFTVQVSSFATPGEYAIGSVFSSWLDENLDEHGFDAQGTFAVTVVPEPGTVGLVLSGLLAGLGAIRRRRP